MWVTGLERHVLFAKEGADAPICPQINDISCLQLVSLYIFTGFQMQGQPQ